MDNQSDVAGKNGFIWWVGFVEDRMDPLKLGRLKVRCVGWDADNKMQLPTDALPWAQVAFPVNNVNPYACREGDMVLGFFADGDAAQTRIVFGQFPGIPLKEANPEEAFSDPREDLTDAPRPPESKEYVEDGTGIVINEKPQADPNPIYLDEPSTSRIARNDAETITETFIQERKDNVVKEIKTYNKEEELSNWDEPETLYDAVYPYNNVMETESGHIVEYDDTPGAERIHIAHRNGSFTEWFPDGDRVEKITKGRYSIVMEDDHLYVMGDCKITVQGNAEIYVQKNMYATVDENLIAYVVGDVDAQVDGNVTALVKGDVDATVNGSVTAQVDGDLSATIDGDATLDIGGDCSETVGGSKTSDVGGDYNISAGNFSVNAGTINLN
jgi:hypothetical protein